MFDTNLYLAIPVCALCCYLFLLFSFLNIPNSRPVQSFRLLLIACVFWTGGASLMRLQITPGISFWFNISILGLILIPIAFVRFLFLLLNIENDRFVIVLVIISLIFEGLNIGFKFFIPPPEVVIQPDGSFAYQYTMPNTVYLLGLFYGSLIGYMIYIAVKKIHQNKELVRNIQPLLLAFAILLIGNLLTTIPGNLFPYDTLSGIIMSICFVYIMYRQYLFNISLRMIVGSLYSLAIILISIPIFLSIRFMKNYILSHNNALDDLGQIFTIFSLLIIAWSILLYYVAWKLSDSIQTKNNTKHLQCIRNFQSEIASLFDAESLYNKIIETTSQIFPKSTIYVFRKDLSTIAEYVMVKTNASKSPTGIEAFQMVGRLNSSVLPANLQISLLKPNDSIEGFIYVVLQNHSRINYLEKDFFQQIGVYASICLKNITIYQQVYNQSIHDEMTGLYNRSYSREFLSDNWIPDNSVSYIYMDMDDFKLINELYGEECGDNILRWCSKVITKRLGPSIPVFRVGSNEFLVVLNDKKSKDDLTKLIHGIQNALKSVDDPDRPKIIQPVQFSIGVAIYPGSATSSEDLLNQAKRACQFAKQNGKNRIEFYDIEKDIKSKDNTSQAEWYEQIAPTVYALTAAIDAKDSYTFRHSCHVSEYAVALAQAYGLKDDEIRIVKEAGLLHDIGKIGIPENILKKKGRLTDEEYNSMKDHVVKSIEMIHFLPNMNYVIPAVLSHHERYDGHGYPRGIAGENIPLLGRILTVCDCFDAMTTKRVYNNARTPEQAVEELIRCKGTQFDPVIVDLFVDLVRSGKIKLDDQV